jgi:hypothetical protein
LLAIRNALSVPQGLLKGELPMKNPLDSLWGTVISGVVLTVIFFYVAQWLVVRTSAGG